MESDEVKIGLRVRVTKLEDDITGMFVKKKYLDVRQVGIKGRITGYVPGHGGDIWWVEHDNGDVGAYIFTEFERSGEK